jgi:hypothetical protein
VRTILDELPYRLRSDVRAGGERRQPGTSLDVHVRHDCGVRWPLRKTGGIDTVHDPMSQRHVGMTEHGRRVPRRSALEGLTSAAFFRHPD